MSKKKTTEPRRTKPRKRVHRAALELTSNPSKTERIVAGARNRYIKVLQAQAAFDEYIAKQIIKSIIEPYNEGVTEDQHIDTIQLFDATGEWKLSFERQIKRSLDGRADMAKNLVEQYLADVENKTVELDADAQLVYNLLRTMFFSRHGFKFTPSLYQFLLLDPAKINDARLRKAHSLLKESVRVDRSNWYAHVYKYVKDHTGNGEYVKLNLNMLED